MRCSAALARSAAEPRVLLRTWLRQATEAENIRVNSAMVRNLLDALSPGRSVQHVALVTGLKHYLGPFEAYGKGALPPTPFREEQARLDVENFYYAQEDEVFAAAARDGFGWSVHRPHTIIGYAVGNAMNMGVTLAVYATHLPETGRPFVFPGSAAQWNGLTDMTDARLLARHLDMGATDAGGAQRGVQRRQRRRVPLELDVGPASPTGSASSRRRSTGEGMPLEQQWPDAAPLWAEIAERHGLAEPDLERRCLGLAHRCRSRPADRGGDRHEQEPQARLPRLSADRRQLLRPVRAAAGSTHHSVTWRLLPRWRNPQNPPRRTIRQQP